MLSVKIVAQKPSGRVMPAASLLQFVAAAWAGIVADHDIITAATTRLRLPDHRTMELIGNKYVHSIVHLCVIPTFSLWSQIIKLYRSAPSLFHSGRDRHVLQIIVHERRRRADTCCEDAVEELTFTFG